MKYKVVYLLIILMVISASTMAKSNKEGVSFLGSGIGYSSATGGYAQLGLAYERYIKKWVFGAGAITALGGGGTLIALQGYSKYYLKSSQRDGLYFIGHAIAGQRVFGPQRGIAGLAVGPSYQWRLKRNSKQYFGLGYLLSINSGYGGLVFDFGINF